MIKISISQINPTAGDLVKNSQIILKNIEKAAFEKSTLLITPELSLTGYPPEDLLLNKDFLQNVENELENLVIKSNMISTEIYVIVGHPYFDKTLNSLTNAATVFRGGKIISRYSKYALPNYEVFDEKRYFKSVSKPCVFNIRGIGCGINICEDIWSPHAPKNAKKAGADILLVLNASPFNTGKIEERLNVVKKNVSAIGLAVVFCNLIGGQDELIFDGNSFFINENGELLKKAKEFEVDFISLCFEKKFNNSLAKVDTVGSKLSQIYKALVLGTHDFTYKNGFTSAIVGLSGGIDSALTLAIAADALGNKNVEAVMMPSIYTSKESLSDAKKCALNLGIKLQILPIKSLVDEFGKSLDEIFKGYPLDITEENLQSRIRGVLLMAISNKKGSMLLTTGNKSEIAMGYCTLYGDMCGGYSVLKDVLKTQVYDLSRYVNKLASERGMSFPIPQSIIDKSPSAELKFNQFDHDSLPPYEILDKVLVEYLEKKLSFHEILRLGYAEYTVKKILKLIKDSEFKRRQSAPGPRLTKYSFGRDWRYPISQNFSYFGDEK